MSNHLLLPSKAVHNGQVACHMVGILQGVTDRARLTLWHLQSSEQPRKWMNNYTLRYNYILLSVINRCPERLFRMGHQGKSLRKD